MLRDVSAFFDITSYINWRVALCPVTRADQESWTVHILTWDIQGFGVIRKIHEERRHREHLESVVGFVIMLDVTRNELVLFRP